MKSSIKDLLEDLQLRVSPAMLEDLNSESSGLQQEIENFPSHYNKQLYKAKLQMLIVWYENKLLEKNRHLLKSDDLVLKLSGLIWDDLQIKIIPFLIDNEVDFETIQAILFNEALYRSANTLLALNLPNSFLKHIHNEAKVRLLDSINAIQEEEARKLCLVFWVKEPDFDNQMLQRIIGQLKSYPLLAKTMLALDATGNYPIKDLYKIIFDTSRHLVESLVHHYKDEFNEYKLKQAKLFQLNKKELLLLTQSFRVLRENHCKNKEFYQLTLENDLSGKILRQFLPGIRQIEKPEYRSALIDLLYTGVTNGFVIQSLKISEISDPALSALAKDLSARFICYKQLRDLGLKPEMAEFAGRQNDLKARRFRQIIMKVEDECKTALKRLIESPQDKAIGTAWQKIESNYRKSLYSIAYDSITKGSSKDLEYRLAIAQQHALDIVDPEIKQPLLLVLICLANILITAFTLGEANRRKEEKTGNYWFFTQSKTGEEIRFMHRDISQILEDISPKPGH